MAYVRRKRIKGNDYYYLVKSFRVNGKVKTRVLKYLGKTPEVPEELRHLLGKRRKRRPRQKTLWDPDTLAAAIVRTVKAGPVRKARERRG